MHYTTLLTTIVRVLLVLPMRCVEMTVPSRPTLVSVGIYTISEALKRSRRLTEAKAARL